MEDGINMSFIFIGEKNYQNLMNRILLC